MSRRRYAAGDEEIERAREEYLRDMCVRLDAAPGTQAEQWVRKQCGLAYDLGEVDAAARGYGAVSAAMLARVAELEESLEGQAAARQRYAPQRMSRAAVDRESTEKPDSPRLRSLR